MLFCIKEEPSKRWRSSIREFSRIEKEASSLPREMEDSSKIVCISERAEEFALSCGNAFMTVSMIHCK